MYNKEVTAVIVTIDKTSDEPIYLQLRSQIVAGIARGELMAGDPLPSVRSLAGDLGINLHTVNKAYAVLRDEGYVDMRGRHGAFISSRRAQGNIPASGLAESLRKLALEHRASGGDRTTLESLFADVVTDVFGPERNA